MSSNLKKNSSMHNGTGNIALHGFNQDFRLDKIWNNFVK